MRILRFLFLAAGGWLVANSQPARPALEKPPAPLTDFVTTASGLQYAITVHGTGPLAQPGQVVVAHYTGTLPDGKVFDSSRTQKTPYVFTLGQEEVIKGWDEGFALLHVGDQATLIIPPELAYGEKRMGPIPPHSTLRFDVELLDVKAHSLAAALREAIDTADLDAGRKRYAELKASGFGDYFVSEAQLNELGYHFLQHGRTAEARAVLQWNVEQFPASGNVYDSLAEVFVKMGDRAKAIENYSKSLELDPKNKNAVKMLAELKATPDAPGALAAMQEKMQLDDEFEAAFEGWEAGKPVDVAGLKERINAFMTRHPDSDAGASFVGNFFYLVEAVDLKQAVAEWGSFATSANPKIRELAEQKLKLVPLMTTPMELSFTAVDGREVDLAKLRGKVVLVDFWATWCGPCVREIPNLVSVYDRHHAKGFEVVGISFDRAPDAAKPSKAARTAEGVQQFAAEHRMPWPQYYDGTYWENPFGKRFGIKGIPAMFLLDKEGRLVSTNARGKKLESEVRRLLAN